ncbi:GlxA family transcriptional regulator [Pimelobacter simplex]|uniref:GlxA family transcriptional regulator n=1 Tax=Nocardioides simplex TaxID=2045 RepID=UPI00214FF769|nr:helix-turn-helix domain-containing protein [Pimelobacter simplex]UUW91155.1 helix-turn-helix domain-containing protein [Pimelobacter simplex]UUW94983.1 helix-turn-helix domain-containing protein [Pimelobacter simplex]
MPAPRVAVIAADGISPFHLSVPSLVWGGEEPAGEMEPWPIDVAAVRPGPVATSAGYAIGVAHGLDVVERADIVVMPWWHDPHRSAPEPVLDALRLAHDRGARVVGLCLGSFVVADAGLLDGRAATTHWKWEAVFRRRFPEVDLRPEELYVDAGAVITGAGATASVDTCLYVLAQRAGQSVANQVARRIVAAPHRAGGQAQYIEAPVPEPGDDPIARAMAWAAGALDIPLGIDDLAAHACMSRSSFTRAFRARTGTSVHPWLVAQRVARAQDLLETTDLAVDEVARHAGFGTAPRLRSHFVAALGVTPTRYRSDFAARAVVPG